MKQQQQTIEKQHCAWCNEPMHLVTYHKGLLIYQCFTCYEYPEFKPFKAIKRRLALLLYQVQKSARYKRTKQQARATLHKLRLALLSLLKSIYARVQAILKRGGMKNEQKQ